MEKKCLERARQYRCCVYADPTTDYPTIGVRVEGAYTTDNDDDDQHHRHYRPRRHFYTTAEKEHERVESQRGVRILHREPVAVNIVCISYTQSQRPTLQGYRRSATATALIATLSILRARLPASTLRAPFYVGSSGVEINGSYEYTTIRYTI